MPPARIAILKPSALGDIVHALPVLTAPARAVPGGAHHLGREQALRAAARRAPAPDRHAAVRPRGVQAGTRAARWRTRCGSPTELRRRRFDLVLDLQGLLRTGLMCRATGRPVRVGFANAREGSRHFYTHRVEVPDADRIHAVDRYWRVAEFARRGRRAKRFLVPLRPERSGRGRPASWPPCRGRGSRSRSGRGG